MRIALINPAVSQEKAYGWWFRHFGSVLPPLGLASLAAVLEKNNFDVSIIDANLLGLSDAQVINKLKGCLPQLIGLTATTLSIENAENLAESIKFHFPEIPVAIGGPHVSGYGKKTLEDCPFFDYGIKGEGEIVFAHLAECLSCGKDVGPFLESLIYRKGESVVETQQAAPIKDIDTLPFSARHLLPPLAAYRPKITEFKKLPLAHIFTSRGCPFSCIFCQTPMGKKVRFHSSGYIVDEIESLVKKYGARELKINDDTFNLDQDRVVRIFEALMRRGIRIPWTCNFRVDTAKDRAFLKTIKDLGCWMIKPGLESGSQKVLNALKKGTNLEQIRQVCAWAKSAGLKIQASFIIGSPLDTKSTIQETIRFARTLPIDYPTFSFMTPFPGTELWRSADRYGVFQFEKFSDLALGSNPTFIPFGLTKQELLDFYKSAYASTYLNPKAFLRLFINIQHTSQLLRLGLAAGSFMRKQ